MLLAAAGSTRYDYVSPLVVLDEIVELCKQASALRVPAPGRPARRLSTITRSSSTSRSGRLFDRIDDEVRVAVGLVEESEYARVFERYVTHVMHAIKKEKVRNPATGRMEDPDESMMREVERTLEITGRADDFRQCLIAKIGAWSLDHRGQKPVMTEIFSDLLRKLKDAYFERHKKTIAKGITRPRRAALGQRRPPVGRGPHARRHRARDADHALRLHARSRRATWSARWRRCATAERLRAPTCRACLPRRSTSRCPTDSVT